MEIPLSNNEAVTFVNESGEKLFTIRRRDRTGGIEYLLEPGSKNLYVDPAALAVGWFNQKQKIAIRVALEQKA